MIAAASSATIVCPGLDSAVTALAARRSLALIPIFGRSLLDRHLAAAYLNGVREVEIIATDRPEAVREAVGQGERWGLRASVSPVLSQAAGGDAITADCLPGGETEAISSYRLWFESVRAAFAAAGANRVGMRETAPGVWIHIRASVDASARLTGPCWIGARTLVGPEAHIGPGAYVEDDCCIDHGVNIEESWIGPGTYVGAFTELIDSLAWGRWLCKWPTGWTTEVADAFLLSDFPAPRDGHTTSWAARLSAVAAVAATWPVVVCAALASASRQKPFLERREAVLPQGRVVRYAEFGALPCLRRWPRLLAIARGDFAWFGNPPLSATEAARLDGEYEKLWTTTPPGLVSLADCFGSTEVSDDEAKAHASYYSACRTARGNLDIVFSLIRRALRTRPAKVAPLPTPANEDLCQQPHPPRN